MDQKELLKKVRKIEIKTKGLSNHIFSGEYHSAFKGRGMSFSEVRAYQYGDDVRSIDWNVTARFNQPFVKVFEEERELTVMLLVDVSQSSAFGSVSQVKRDMLTEISAVLAFSAINNNDKVGIILFSDQVELYIPPKKGRFHILRIIRELIDFTPRHNGTAIGPALSFFNRVIKKRSIAFLLSDFMDSSYADALSLAARRHDMVGIQVYDQRDQTLPNVGLMEVLDAESGQSTWLDTSRKKVRQAYANQFMQYEKYLHNAFTRSGKDYVKVGTHQSYVRALMQLFKKREAAL